MPKPQRNQSLGANSGTDGGIARLGMALANWSQRWFPDAFVFALVAIAVVFVAGLFLGTAPRDLAQYFGEGFWSLIPFTMQMSIIIIGSYVVATSPPMQPVDSPARRHSPDPSRRGSLCGVFLHGRLAASLISWGFSLIFAGILVRVKWWKMCAG